MSEDTTIQNGGVQDENAEVAEVAEEVKPQGEVVEATETSVEAPVEAETSTEEAPAEQN